MLDRVRGGGAGIRGDVAFDALIGSVAEACASDDESLIEQTYLAEDLPVPAALIR